MSPIYVPGKVVLRKTWQPMDADAAAYITAVETADGQALEEKVKIAIDNFVLGCKADGIWSAIKASCILAGARTRLGALTPLAGTAPTSFNFVDGDYNRKTGLVGNGSTKYLDSNRNNNTDPQNSRHLSVYRTTAETREASKIAIGNGTTEAGASQLLTNPDNTVFRLSRTSGYTLTETRVLTGLFAASRVSVVEVIGRYGNVSTTGSDTSSSPSSGNILVFARNAAGPSLHSNARLAFYSIGESLDLAKLDARVTDLINAFGVAIP
jgi:hypothetical protein